MHFTKDVKEALNHKYSDMANEMKKQGKNIVSLCVGEPDLKVPEYVIDGIYKAMKDGKTHYSNCQGVLELREAIVKDLNDKLDNFSLEELEKVVEEIENARINKK